MTKICTSCGARVAGQTSNSLPVLAHILGFFTSWLGPLIMLLATKEERVRNHARMALNWQLSLIIYLIVAYVLILLSAGFVALAILVLFIGIPLLVVLGVLDTIFCIMAAVKASRGELWKYHLSIPFLKARPDSTGTVV